MISVIGFGILAFIVIQFFRVIVAGEIKSPGEREE